MQLTAIKGLILCTFTTINSSHPSLYQVRDQFAPNSALDIIEKQSSMPEIKVICKRPKRLRRVRNYLPIFQGVNRHFGNGVFNFKNSNYLVRTKRCQEVIKQLKGSTKRHGFHSFVKTARYDSRYFIDTGHKSMNNNVIGVKGVNVKTHDSGMFHKHKKRPSIHFGFM